MKRLYFVLLLFFFFLSFGYAQKRQVKKITTLGYAYNYGTGEVETGGKSLGFGTKIIGPGDKIYFELISGKVKDISIVAVNKYDVWTNILNSGRLGTMYNYNGYFKRYTENNDFKSYKISVNGSHNQYEREACVIKVCLISKSTIRESDYKTVLETAAPNYQSEYKGIACDGVSSLRIDFYYPGNSSIKVDIPDFGEFKISNGNKLSKGQKYLSLDEAGHSYIIFTPPSQVDQELWKGLKIMSKEYYESISDGLVDNTPKHWVGNKLVPLIPHDVKDGDVYLDLLLPVIYSDIDSKFETNVQIIKVTRPPVIFVHGYLGSSATWRGMGLNLGNYGFQTFVKNYLTGEGSIGDQSEKLATDIEDDLESMNRSGIKISKVDLIGHSMGGLIIRDYVQNDLYQDNVRKIIMVGTPNHGVGNMGYYIGKMGSAWKKQHQKAIYELRENSRFLQQLNSGEYGGAHLVKGIEYGNIYTNPWDYVVWASSARLNMVPSSIIYGVSHSTDISSTAITNHPSVESQIITWLGMEIRRAPNIYLKAELSRASKGEIYRTYFPPGSYNIKEEKITSFPCEFKLYHSLKTGEGKAIIHLKAGNKIWGSIFVYENSEIHIGSCSPDWMEIRLLNGSAQFKSIKANGCHFLVQIQDKDSSTDDGGSFSFNPRATVKGLDTEFAIEYEGDEIKVFGMEGKMEILTDLTPTGKPVTISDKESVIIENNQITEIKYEEPKWTTDLNEEVDEKTGEEIVEKDSKEKNSTANEAGSIVVLLIGLGVVLFVLAIVVLIIVLIVRAVRKGKRETLKR
jgi:triacylglycerol esterase/lipase EstA (alpha/beta hydrolase family)